MSKGSLEDSKILTLPTTYLLGSILTGWVNWFTYLCRCGVCGSPGFTKLEVSKSERRWMMRGRNCVRIETFCDKLRTRKEHGSVATWRTQHHGDEGAPLHLDRVIWTQGQPHTWANEALCDDFISTLWNSNWDYHWVLSSSSRTLAGRWMSARDYNYPTLKCGHTTDFTLTTEPCWMENNWMKTRQKLLIETSRYSRWRHIILSESFVRFIIATNLDNW